jgi:CRISPR type III-A-associated RAMP protein Csm4
MTYRAYFLNFDAPLHLSDHKPDSYETSESFLRSDTIVAALMAAWGKIGLKDWIGDGIMPFTVSSAFPFYQKGKMQPLLFFPRPKMPFKVQDQEGLVAKDVKKVKWIDQTHFERMINGKSIDMNNILHGDYMTGEDFFDDFMVKQVSERVTIPRDRSAEDSKPFYMERIYFQDGGLYFLAMGDHLDRINKALDFLQHEGIGTDRNVGHGFFTYTYKDIELSIPENTQYSMSIGLYCPVSKNVLQEDLGEKAAYDMVKRGGYITKEGYQTLEKNSVYMMTEGSVFQKSVSIDGHPNIDLTPTNIPESLRPPHRIFRCGRTLFIPVKI